MMGFYPAGSGVLSLGMRSLSCDSVGHRERISGVKRVIRSGEGCRQVDQTDRDAGTSGLRGCQPDA